jgi:hypothetical protein
MPKPKPLCCWNGYWNGSSVHVNVCAHSRADAGRLLVEYGASRSGIDKMIKDYYSECWGNNMDGITPERGLWVVPFHGAQPSRVI